MINSTSETIYYHPYVDIWDSVLATPLPHDKYINIFGFAIYQNNFFHIQSLVTSVILIVWLIYRLSHSPFPKPRRTHLTYLFPGKWMTGGNVRSLSVMFVLMALACTLIWSAMSLGIVYYEGSNKGWTFLYENVVVSNGSTHQIEEIRNSLYRLESTEKNGSYQRLLQGIPLVRQETPMEYQDLQQNTVGNSLRHPHNSIVMANITLSTQNPSIITNRHMFDRWLPELYYPSDKYWKGAIRFQLVQALGWSLTTSSIFFGISSLRPVWYLLNNDQEIMGRPLSLGFLVYGLVRLMIFPTVDLLKCDFEVLGLGKRVPRTDQRLGSYFVPYNEMREEQQKLQLSRAGMLETIKQEDPELYHRVVGLKAQLTEHPNMNFVQQGSNLWFSPWLIGIIKQYISFLERIGILVAIVLLQRRTRRSKSRTKSSKAHDAAQDLVDKIQKIETLRTEHSERDPAVPVGETEIELSQFVVVLVVNCVVLVTIPLLHLIRPHSAFMLDNPMLQDIVGQFHWTTETLLILYIVILLFPQGSSDVWIHPDCLEGMESVLWSPEDPDVYSPYTTSSVSTLDSLVYSSSSQSQLDTLPKQLKYLAPSDYPLPEWVSRPIDQLAPSPSERTSPRTECHLAGTPSGSLLTAHIPPMQVQISIDPVHDPTVPISSRSQG